MNNSDFETHIFRKATFTGLLLNFNAMCPENWKKGLILGLLHRAYTACSSWKLFHNEIEKIVQLLKTNNYPENFVYKIINSFLSNKLNNVKRDKSDSNFKYSFRLPYIGNPSLILKRKLQRLFKSHDIDVNIVFSSFKVRNYFSLKDKSDKLLRSSLVYIFECPEDPSNTYIGKTKRYLHKRVTEHQKIGSAIFSHIQDCHKCQNSKIFDSFSVLNKANSDFDLQILEALYIIDRKPNLNKQLAGDGSSFVLNLF